MWRETNTTDLGTFFTYRIYDTAQEPTFSNFTISDETCEDKGWSYSTAIKAQNGTSLSPSFLQIAFDAVGQGSMTIFTTKNYYVSLPGTQHTVTFSATTTRNKFQFSHTFNLIVRKECSFATIGFN